jgi:DnaK suppressor protein
MPLQQVEIERVKKKLEHLKNQITRSIQEAKEGVKEFDESKGYSQHQADEGTDDFDKTISLEVSNKELNILKQIDRALEKIQEGTYGICDLSGKEISKARLEAIPYATMTVDAQEKLEKGIL